MPVHASEDIIKFRQAVRVRAVGAGFSLIDQTKIVTAASEIARNMIDWGGGGEARIDMVRVGARRGVRLTFIDHGAGIADLERAMVDGYTSGRGLGLGLSGAKRLSSEFDIESTPGKGTTVILTRWK